MGSHGHMDPHFQDFFEAKTISEENYIFWIFTSKWKNGSKPPKQPVF